MDAIDWLKYREGAPLLFSSGLFFVAFVIFYGVYIALKQQQRLRILWVLAFSMFFYYKSSGLHLLLLISLALMDYFAAGQIHKSRGLARRRFWLILSLAGNLGALFYFKCTTLLMTSLGFQAMDMVLPVGISFFTFQSLSYTVDIYRRQIPPARSLTDYLFFATFFPQLVAGPIVRASAFLPQIRKSVTLSADSFGRAWFLILGGLFKKAIISDYISINFVDRVFDSPGLYSSLENLCAVYGYALQIYCDFSGYSDMAIGIALLMGFHLPINFDRPYVSGTLTEFWHRWHISLSTWLRDYLYIPLGGNRGSRLGTYVNLMVTMLLGGLWHGASWKFLAWGGIHGLGLALEKALGLSWRSWPAKIFTFHLVCLGWVYFRAADFGTASIMLEKIGGGPELRHLGELVGAYPGVFALMVLGYVLHFLPLRADEAFQASLTRAPIWGKAVALAVLIWILIQVRSAQIQPFIYFQF